MGSYIATWGVFVLDVDGPVEAARIARQMADDHSRWAWGVEDCESGKVVTVNTVKGVIVNTETAADDYDEGEEEVA